MMFTAQNMPSVQTLNSMKRERMSAAAMTVGDIVNILGSLYYVVEWMRVGPDGEVLSGGLNTNGRPWTSRLSPGSMATIIRV